MPTQVDTTQSPISLLKELSEGAGGNPTAGGKEDREEGMNIYVNCTY